MGSRAEAGRGEAEQLEAAVNNQQSIVNMPSSRWTWTRPTTHIYSYNREAQNILGSRSARATSVAATESRSALTSTSESNVRSLRAASVAAPSDFIRGVQWILWPSDGLDHAEAGPNCCCCCCSYVRVPSSWISCAHCLPQESHGQRQRQCKCKCFLILNGSSLHCCFHPINHHH